MKKHVLVTGGAGFIGSTLAEELIKDEYKVTVVDNFDSFYDREIKERNITWLLKQENFRLIEIDIQDYNKLKSVLRNNIDIIVHIAAKAGVHESIKDPINCQKVNVVGTQNMLELAKEIGVNQFVFASSSSVYGVNPNTPWSEDDKSLKPISPYASSKLSCEMLGHVYSSLYDIRFLSLRFFTVYGPRQRPDLAIHKFACMIEKGEEITQYGDGSSRRDYTYIDDIINGVKSAIEYDKSNYEIINLGNNQTVSLSEMIEIISDVFGKKAMIKQLPDQPGDVRVTYANVSKAERLLNYKASTNFREGIVLFREWFMKNEIS
ncbi:GDP-mannose 4,6-dehydratase [Portibacter lacus]|uniref:Epimerase n=1 Tax=Portibacter lacus TaxID=1099794 RepID=A0AA37SL51_9BACT|nr:GDP-mannose 4,6-dehydratase [Portibacter lacus]GLR15925.1 epimerase [Portibacter lacus]